MFDIFILVFTQAFIIDTIHIRSYRSDWIYYSADSKHLAIIFLLVQANT